MATCPEKVPMQHLPGASRLVSAFEGYELWAPTYDHDPNPLLALEERVFPPLFPPLRGREVLDLGCGTGRWLAKLLRWGARQGAGMDFSPAMLSQAQAKEPLRNRLVRADLGHLPFRPAFADLIICSFALGHVSGLLGVVSELARVAKGGAGVFITDLHPEAYAQGWRNGFRSSGQAIEVMGSPHSREQITQAFTLSGFELVRYEEPHLGEPEKEFFARADKSHLYHAACAVPAILIGYFKRVGKQA